MKNVTLLLASLLYAAPLQAQPAADSFIFPVRATNAQNILENIRDPASGNGWFVTGNPVGRWASNGDRCITGFHDGDDWNRQDGNYFGEPVYAVANGKVVRVSTVLAN